ncbi:MULTISPECIES: DUF692 domain-containing protein [Acidithiobacillaceae]|uniref:DUF692 domain-containing protein n=1 Tax=Igneacidithiobacillus copahuensis TaxID=2724909 RepID=A0AAE2YNS9_9PROT|nr:MULTISPECIES: DUF692 domain-containing protein [Acidithiobacillaceae]MBU2763374.1 DUF692 domain-containing protein [Acidithiobacillus caldus]MBU2771213.1 DUF692 domain-containing protein [Acidithiobacillus caldus]MBU2787241.1 DUF692 domain-containing protein [Igneacidithiobacillus copahuensis]MBU2797891.1 DUF692 domain-containing protein [Acidithiobacillus sp. VAN18-2]
MHSFTGIGLRAPHVEELLRTKPVISTLEVYSEDYLGADRKWIAELDEARADYPITLHGVGLSIGSSDPLNTRYLQRLRALIHRVDPLRVSDHLAWCSMDGQYFGDQYPIPRQHSVLQHLVSRIEMVQDFLKRPLLLENIAFYLQPEAEDQAEYSDLEFWCALATHSGCQMLLDVENLRINCRNHGGDPWNFLDGLPTDLVAEIHVAGGERLEFAERTLHVDTHSRRPGAQTRTLYAAACARFPDAVRILEWDTEIPKLPELLRVAQSLESVA